MEESEERTAVANLIAGNMAAQHFIDLAAAFGGIDAAAAERAISEIERDCARGLHQLRDEFIKGRGTDDMLAVVGTRLRQMFIDARAEIAKAAKPH